VPLGIIGFLAVFSFFRVAGEHALLTFLNVYFDLQLGISTAQIGLLFAIGQLIAVPGAIAYPSLAERWGDFRTIAFGVVGVSLALLPIILVPHWAPAAVSFAGVMAGVAVVNIAVGVYSQSMVPEAWRSVISGALGMANGLGVAAISMGGGIMVGTLGYRSFFGVSAALTLLGVLIFWGYFRVPRGEFVREAVEQPSAPLLGAEGSAD
jgi:predicted MFS family arabinose efflux permease